MTLALTLVLHALAGASGECYVVTNTRIVVLPTCDIGPDTVTALTEEPGSARPDTVALRRRAPSALGRGPFARGALAPDAGRAELERRLDAEQQQRISAVAQRVAAERARDEAIRERDQALREVARARRTLAEAGQSVERGGATSCPGPTGTSPAAAGPTQPATSPPAVGAPGRSFSEEQ